MRAQAFAAAAIAVALAGCAAPVFEGGRAWAQGWREGRVEKIGAAVELGGRQSWDCRYRDGGAGRNAPGRFAVVGLEQMGRHRHHVAPLPPDMHLPVGSSVLTRWRGCDPPTLRTAPVSDPAVPMPGIEQSS